MIHKISIKIRKTEGVGLLHDSRKDVNNLAKVCNELINKVNELVEKVNTLEKNAK